MFCGYSRMAYSIKVLLVLSLVACVLSSAFAASIASEHNGRGLTNRGDAISRGSHRGQQRGLAKSKDKVNENDRQQSVKNDRKSDIQSNPDKFLEQFGYLPKPRANVSHSPESRKEAIRNFQRMTGLEVTGDLNRATLEKMASPRCGMPDMVPEDADIPDGVARDPSRIQAPPKYYVPGYKWNKRDLSWKVINYSPDMSDGSQRRAFQNGLRHWSDVSSLTFREMSRRDSREADIEIKFAAPHYDHGDGYGNAFDGEGGTLAHAFYPESGDTHFDEGELWTEGEDRGTNLEIVAAHEFGHALGLGHSSQHTALMAPYYQGYDPNFRLHTDDIQGIQSLYGGNRRPVNTPRPPTQKPPTRPPSGRPDTCGGKFDAVYQGADGQIYALSGKWVFRMNYWALEDEFPKQTRHVFDDPIPHSVAAAVHSWRSRYTYFFKGKKVLQYYGGRRLKRKTIRTSGYQTPQSAIMSRDGKIYLLRGNYYWQFDESRLDIVAGSRGRINTKWPGIPSSITAAVRLSDGYLYFFKGAKYRKYDESRRAVLPGYPKETAGPWMGPTCTSNGRYQPK